MQRLITGYASMLLFITLFSACNKIDWRPPTDCDVQQFGQPGGVLYVGPRMEPFPFLFSKTYDASGNVQTIDAYLLTMGADFNLKSRFSLKGQTLYFIEQSNPSDTFMVVQLNAKGRPVKATETRYLNPNRSNFPAQEYEFTYKKTQLSAIVVRQAGRVARVDSCTYDTYGNILARGRTAGYEYDYTQKPKQQFYFDGDNIGAGDLGFSLLQYLNFFPELTSPVNVRTKQKNQRTLTGGYLFEFDLANHKFDSKRKLISYDYGFSSIGYRKVTTPVIYNCDAQGSSAK